MNIAAIILDLDGTLLNSEKKVTDRNLKAILACHQSGMQIIFATARPPRAVKQMLPQKLQDIGSFVFYNGAMVSCVQTNVNAHYSIPSSLSRELLDYCVDSHPDIVIGVEVQDEWFSLREVDDSVVKHVRGRPVLKTMEELRQYDATKILISGLPDYKFLFERFGSSLNIILTDNGTLVQIMSKDASKEQAVRFLCEKFGISLEKVMAFGDDYNDIGLSEICGYSVAMGNAVAPLKAMAQEVTVSNDEDGVALVLEQYLLTTIAE
ncbi:Cof subfamily of IIB subfamily of haloacid dehalogenase superfamily/HAD-superfamily hydrolase, subfamily IIB [Paenibacillus sophorae]|uniref:Cof subfamily of IIB subfamily of haloacid dehalogenase superfamily/HAD-superfamily hydrolase, subfamily IIB n=1 Tax=Paenibacillus sophorae TaxID=1333845 RepID=A0A1H8QVE2_9BACL|nr:Cof-type HAD-IIB family hydrolase [Paenibacillus sophorae]QWU14837.1 Cof-type HAD-IIB family hydrolase [Paenibacillus sophorae]SEO57783.1 Cof subfamily of IIB subfamily of haloacid dehalogenase superfamily/HAD-superfamily hydrolase, subfamily IIB [Paenibacillus sophorae]